VRSAPRPGEGIGRRWIRRIAISFGGAVLLLVLCFTVFLWWLHPGYEPLPFTPDAWAAAEPEARGHMSDDLLERYELVGMGEKEVLALLGEPDNSVTVEELADRRAREKTLREYKGPLDWACWELGYLGYRREYPLVFPHRLHLQFRDGRVARFYIDD